MARAQAGNVAQQGIEPDRLAGLRKRSSRAVAGGTEKCFLQSEALPSEAQVGGTGAMIRFRLALKCAS